MSTLPSTPKPLSDTSKCYVHSALFSDNSKANGSLHLLTLQRQQMLWDSRILCFNKITLFFSFWTRGCLLQRYKISLFQIVLIKCIFNLSWNSLSCLSYEKLDRFFHFKIDCCWIMRGQRGSLQQ